jgi:hypothetical protein
MSALVTTGGGQVFRVQGAGSAGPGNTASARGWRKQQILSAAADLAVCLWSAEQHFDNAIGHIYAGNVISGNRGGRGQSGGLIAGGKCPCVRKVVPNGHLGTGGQGETLGHLTPDQIILVSGNGNGGDDRNDSYHYH